MNIDPLIVRRARNWSQKQLAEYLGVNQATVSRWEHGAPISGPALKIIHFLAEGGEGIARPSPQSPTEGDFGCGENKEGIE